VKGILASNSKAIRPFETNGKCTEALDKSVSTSAALTEIYGKGETNARIRYVNVAPSCFHSIKFIIDKEILDARRVKITVKLRDLLSLYRNPINANFINA
jgi:hypothetical protein